ncbi:hypothetical protein DV451_001421 [Geotrichum candidum]|uniref:Translocase of outer membrane 40 kDa subunit n=1 Tax=Geotrichum candidum TaxID=1173061 RepID=A0A0J9X9R0_GEOCN|nr:hypothetical protein DV451_001421 [Geotrichum candidum]KAI9212215.1 hypothetical protein DS838_002917 [Geotrichum bryndzae]KAF5106678.1 hypothetical protein DV453_003727 [Geotrichum candidum]KAF5119054.1 hypothetical protein DV454_000156 [Geotrichum candidum]KAF5121625.1 hypothetical protein DV452_000695 [Geotrichum candidum]
MAAPVIPNLGDISKLPLGSIPGASFKAPPSVWETNPVLSPFNSLYNAVAARRATLGLSNPGTIENLNKEVSKDVFLNNYFFSGLRADLSKPFSMNPVFQVSHSFAIGSPVMPAYGFAAFYATDNVLLQGNMDVDRSLSGRFHYAWTKNFTTKANVQIANGQPSMLQVEHDYQGPDYSLNLKTLNPSILDGAFTGVAVGSILQAITPKLALGLETVYSAQSVAHPPDAAVSFVGRYVSGDWIASTQLQAQGALIASFYRKVTDKVEAGVEANIGLANPQAAMMGGAEGPTVEGTTTIGAKYEFRQSVFRGQIDSNGKVSCLLERRVLPVVSVTFAGEIDHAKNSSRIGLGLQFEAGGEELYAQGPPDPSAQPHPPM